MSATKARRARRAGDRAEQLVQESLDDRRGATPDEYPKFLDGGRIQVAAGGPEYELVDPSQVLRRGQGMQVMAYAPSKMSAFQTVTLTIH